MMKYVPWIKQRKYEILVRGRSRNFDESSTMSTGIDKLQEQHAGGWYRVRTKYLREQ